ncbi:MAG: succinylglutamate desuccinylase/aspartoacylase family protein [Hyphomicrobiaceae bacterium]|nr:succinylglutamate desuccinylase/aspartoacylase family protein [Hyphomicrobiaceae bacterium]
MTARDFVPALPVAPLEVEGYRIEPGAKRRLQLDLCELADGTAIKLPVIAANGVRPGPRLYIGAGIHGDEVSGTAMVARLMAEIEPAQLAGSIVAIPVQHPLAFQADHRFPLSQLMKSPLDQSPIDAWTSFPGDANGNLSQMLAAKIFALVKASSFALDIHTPTRGGRYVPISILPAMALGAEAERALWLAEQVSSGFIVKGRTGMYVSRGIQCVEATAAGVPSFTFEIGEGGRLEPEVVEEGLRCLRNGLIGLGMIEGTRIAAPVAHVMGDFLGLRAKRGGLLFTLAKLGDTVEKGQPLARTLDVWGDEVETFRAPERGVFVRATTLSTVSTGERVATLGLL